jgi:hypothetical protein
MRRTRRARASVLASAVVPLCLCTLCALSSRADAHCPNEPVDDTLCEPKIAFLQPTVAGAGYFPRHAHGPMLGGGLEIVWLAWTSNTTSFGPSHGKLSTSVIELAALRDSERALSWFTSALVSFEKNPSRRFLIPYFGPSFGELLPSFDDHRFFVDGTLGAYLYQTPSFAIDARGSYVFALSSSDALSGMRATLSASLSLW